MGRGPVEGGPTGPFQNPGARCGRAGPKVRKSEKLVRPRSGPGRGVGYRGPSAAGSATSAVRPPPARACNRDVPPDASASWRTIASPRPVPPGGASGALQKRSNARRRGVVVEPRSTIEHGDLDRRSPMAHDHCDRRSRRGSGERVVDEIVEQLLGRARKCARRCGERRVEHDVDVVLARRRRSNRRLDRARRRQRRRAADPRGARRRSPRAGARR